MSQTAIYAINQKTSTSMTINGTYADVINNVIRGQYNITLSINGTVTALLALFFFDSSTAYCIITANCGANPGEFINNECYVPLYSPFDAYTLILKYTSNTLQVKTSDSSSISNCIFTSNSFLSSIPDGGNLNYTIDNLKTSITGSAINCTSGQFNLSPSTGCYLINNKNVLSIENNDCIPRPFMPSNTSVVGTDASDTSFRGAIYEVSKPVSFNKILFRVQQPALANASTLRVSLFQREGGLSANNTNQATLISTASTGLVQAGGSTTNTNIVLSPTGDNFLSPGVFYGLVRRDSGGGDVSFYCYDNNSIDILNSNMITGCPSTFSTSMTGTPTSFDPDSTTAITTDVATIFRLFR